MVNVLYFDHDPEMGRPFLTCLQDVIERRSGINLTVLPAIEGGKEWDTSVLERGLVDYNADVLLIHPGLGRQGYVFNRLLDRFPALRVGILSASPDDYVESRGNVTILPRQAYERLVEYIQTQPAPVPPVVIDGDSSLAPSAHFQPRTTRDTEQPTKAEEEIDLERLLTLIRHRGIPPHLEEIIGEERTEQALTALERSPEEGYRAAHIRRDTPEAVKDRYRKALVASSVTRAMELVREPIDTGQYPRKRDQRLLDFAFQKLFDEERYTEVVNKGWQFGSHPVLQAAGRKLYERGDYRTAFIAAYNGDDKELLGQLVRPLLQAGHWEQVATAISSLCVAQRPHGLTSICYSDPTLAERYIPNARETLREVVETLVTAPLQRSDPRQVIDKYEIAHTLALQYVPELLEQARTRLIEANPKKAYHKGRGGSWAPRDEELTKRARTALLELSPEVAYETGRGNRQMPLDHPYGPDQWLVEQSREPFAKKDPERALQAAKKFGDNALKDLAIGHLLSGLPSELKEVFS